MSGKKSLAMKEISKNKYGVKRCNYEQKLKWGKDQNSQEKKNWGAKFQIWQ